MKLALSLVVFSIAAITACNNEQQKTSTAVDTPAVTTTPMPEVKPVVIDSTILQVHIDTVGLIHANGNSISLKSLDSAFMKLKKINGEVRYSSDNGAAGPAKEATQVIQLASKHNLPIKFYTDKTFTEIVKLNQ